MTRPPAYQQFVPLPSDETLRIAWPTLNQSLFDAPEKFFARTRINPDYGKPGWTRDCGKRFHRGCDIAPVVVSATGHTTRVIFTDCATGRDFESEEPTFVPHDEVFCVFDGAVAGLADDESASDFGRHIIVAHRWPGRGTPFYTLYAHLNNLDSKLAFQNNDRCAERHIAAGQRLGRMGQSSRSAEARNWMAIAPHLHFEVWDAAGRPYEPVEFLRAYCERCH
jgi:hypothetical protein